MIITRVTTTRIWMNDDDDDRDNKEQDHRIVSSCRYNEMMSTGSIMHKVLSIRDNSNKSCDGNESRAGVISSHCRGM